MFQLTGFSELCEYSCLVTSLPVLIPGVGGEPRDQGPEVPWGPLAAAPSPTCGLGTSGIRIFLLGAKERDKGQGAPDSPSGPLTPPGGPKGGRAGGGAGLTWD